MLTRRQFLRRSIAVGAVSLLPPLVLHFTGIAPASASECEDACQTAFDAAIDQCLAAFNECMLLAGSDLVQVAACAEAANACELIAETELFLCLYGCEC